MPGRILAILGSPHRDGTSAHMMGIALDAALRAGYEADTICLYDKRIAYCTGCRACLGSGRCVQEDDLQEVAGLLRRCDIVILASPVYWANVPAAVKNLFDRLLGTAMEETRAFPKPRLSHGQRYLLLTSCNTPFPFSWLCGQSRGALRAMDEFFRTSGMRRLGRAVRSGADGRTDIPPALEAKIRCLFR